MAHPRRWLLRCWTLALLLVTVHAYIPSNAVENNQLGLDLNDASQLRLTWRERGTYQEAISYQLARLDSTGVARGALVRVREEDLNDIEPTTTPWTALISCDQNATLTNGSLFAPEVDIFTAVRDRGAVAALLYSNVTDGCLINSFYASDAFDQIMDIFSTKKAATARLIQSQFQNINYTYTMFNSALLNDSAAQVNASLSSTRNTSPFLIATLRAENATEPDDLEGPVDEPSSGSGGGNSRGPNGLALIILYVITGLVSALFCIVILSGAIRAFRHPERYGPRTFDPSYDGPGNYAQTRAAGLTRAILDTFPIVKFGRSDQRSNMENGMHQPARHEMKAWEIEDRPYTNGPERDGTHPDASSLPLRPHESALGSSGPASRTSGESTSRAKAIAAALPQPESEGEPSSVDPAAIGRETCPICIVDFEDGDDLRVLPCEGKHRFHKDCVDPWLLELSSSCPICREDFQALETMATVHSELGHGSTTSVEQRAVSISDSQPPDPHPHISRFSRYIHFAQKRRRSLERSNEQMQRD